LSDDNRTAANDEDGFEVGALRQLRCRLLMDVSLMIEEFLQKHKWD
jgi:hypothetical protein